MLNHFLKLFIIKIFYFSCIFTVKYFIYLFFFTNVTIINLREKSTIIFIFYLYWLNYKVYTFLNVCANVFTHNCKIVLLNY